MFNLLRRRSKRKNKETNHNANIVATSDEDAEPGVGAAIARNYAAQRANVAVEQEKRQKPRSNTKQERYRQFSECESEREHYGAAYPYRRAVIEELDDFGVDFEETATTDSNKKIYFEQQQQPQQNQTLPSQQTSCRVEVEGRREEHDEKVKLAKTAANLWQNAVATEAKETHEEFITRTTANTTAAATNSAYLNESKTKRNVCNDYYNNINKINANTDAAHVHVHVVPAEKTTFSAGNSIAQSIANTGRNQNDDNDDDAKTFGTNLKLIGKIKSQQQDNENENADADVDADDQENDERQATIEVEAEAEEEQQFNSSQDRLQVAIAAAAAAGAAAKIDIVAESQVEDAKQQKQQIVTPQFANSKRTTADDKHSIAADTVINAVKYRNTNVKKNQRDSKRQSRLSLTNFGLNLTSNTTKTEATIVNGNGNVVNEPQIQTQQQRKSKSSLFFGSNNSNNNNSSSNKATKLTVNNNNNNNNNESRTKYRPLQKSREFLSDIFMARGRNHNRNRNNHNPQTHQNQQQQQQPQQQQQQCQSQSLQTTTQVSMGNDDDVINNMEIEMDNKQLAHLEMNSDPALSVVASTNSYQMTASNNSIKNLDTLTSNTQHVNGVAEEANEQQINAQSVCEQTRVNLIASNSAESNENNEELVVVAGAVTDKSSNSSSSNDQQAASLNDFIHAANVDCNGTNERQLNVTKEKTRVDNSDDNSDDTDAEIEDKIIEAKQITERTPGALALDDVAYKNKAECVGELLQLNNSNNNNCNESTEIASVNYCGDACDITSMGQSQSQSNGKSETGTASNSRASTPREFRESNIGASTPVRPPRANKSVGLPTITVVDYSDSGSRTSSLEEQEEEDEDEEEAEVEEELEQNTTEQEIYYDFEQEQQQQQQQQQQLQKQQQNKQNGVQITPIDIDIDVVEALDDEDNDEVFDIPTTVYQQPATRWTRLSHIKLENVPEQEEDEEEDEEEVEDDEEGEGVDEDDDPDSEHEQQEEEERQQLLRQRRTTSTSTPERHARSPLKSTNTSDSNLSTSYPDSGIGMDSIYNNNSNHNNNNNSTTHTAATTNIVIGNESIQRHQMPGTLRLPFVRDGDSTDCDETLMQCDELDIEPHERLVCIESISLPDVVVESTTDRSNASSSTSIHANGGGGGGGIQGTNGNTEHILNINGATGNSVGNVHFIPIHIEGGFNAATRSRSSSPKQMQQHRSFDDSCIGSKKSPTMPPTIEIIEDASILTTTSKSKSSNAYSSNSNYETDLLKQELNEQKSQHAIQLEDAQKNVHNLQHKVSDMQTKIEKLEQELSLKTWNVERLQGELTAAHKDDEFVRKKLKLLEEEKTNLRHKYSENEDEFRRKYDDLEIQYNEIAAKYKETQSLASNLQTQVAAAQLEAENWRQEVNKIRDELEEQLRLLKNALENSEAERKICENKWQTEFEMLRTHNIEREETLMTDCEWQLRQMQKQCKERYDKAEHERHKALEKSEDLEQELTQRQKEIENLRVYQAQVNSLRGIVTEQEISIQTLMEQIERLRAELETANENLETQIEAVSKIKYQCDNAIYDKERQMIYRIDEVRNEAAAFWEDKLYTEMTRLKNELESVYVDDRREELDKLQTEHIEELRALTTRYTANEDELRAELEELQERLDRKSEEFIELREKSDSTLLQTRMHLDRADREYQNAMCREEERREQLEEKLHKEFQAEKQEMEEKFRERLGQVKDEFARELQLSTQEMAEKHQKALEQYKAKLLAEKDEALQELTDRHRKKLAAAEEKIKDVELRHQRDLKDLKAAYDAEKAALDKRDISNANEIEMLHRKCRCLTNLFEEMRMRYERRDPRQEDLREITELRGRCDSQERDLYLLTDRLREMQIQMAEMQQNDANMTRKQNVKKPPPKTIPTNCDVIYEENEERETPPPSTNKTNNNFSQEVMQKNDNDDNDVDDDDDDAEQSDTESNHKIEINGKNIDTINEDDAHMITAM